MRSWLCLCLLSIVLLTSVGCGGNSDGLVPTTGTITIDGQPGSNASVAFIPQAGTSGNGGTAATDATGKFEILTPQGKKGLLPGKYKVTVSRRLNDDGTPPDPNTPPIESSAKERLPLKYTDREKTELSATIAVDDKPHKFVLQTAKKK